MPRFAATLCLLNARETQYALPLTELVIVLSEVLDGPVQTSAI